MTILDERPVDGGPALFFPDHCDADWDGWFADDDWREKISAEMAKVIPATDVLPDTEPDEGLQTFWESVDAARRPLDYPTEVFPMSPISGLFSDMAAALESIRDTMAASPETNWALAFCMCSPSRHHLLQGLRDGEMYVYTPEWR